VATSVSKSSSTTSSVTVNFSSNYYGASTFDLYRDNNYITTRTGTGSGYYSTSYTFTGLSAGTSYTFAARVKNSSGTVVETGSGTFSTDTPPDTTPPYVTTPLLVDRGSDWIKVGATATDSSGTNASGAAGINFRINGGSANAEYVNSSGYATCTFTGLQPETTYSFAAQAWDNKLNYSSWTGTNSYATLVARPENFSFSSFVSSGNGTTQLAATSWNNFTARINAFRKWKNLTAYTFTTVYSGNIIKATYINQAIAAIDAMSPYVPTPSTKAAGSTCTAATFTALKNALNSL
jgi:hypothetical protein